jgi:hypothetical protein
MDSDNRLVDADLFDAMADGRLDGCVVSSNAAVRNYCPDCPDMLMQLQLNEYKCPSCGRTEPADITGLDIKTLMGANTLGRFRSAEGYIKTQKEAIVKLMKSNNDSFTGDKFPPELLEEVASQYNIIQNLAEEIYDDAGKVVGTKKFVRRRNIKDEVLATLIYLECINRKVVRKKKDVAAFMKLQTNGFSSGENILRSLYAEGKITIDIGDEPVDGFAMRYLDGLGIENVEYTQFITDIIRTAEAKNIGVNSITSSKVVGTIWLLNMQLGLNIKVDQLERAGDNTKKNTFIKFYNEVVRNIKLFVHVFKKYNIPVPK